MLAKKKPSVDTCYQGDAWVCAVEAAIVKETNAVRAAASKKDLIHSFESSFVARQWSVTEDNSKQISHDGFPADREANLTQEFPDADWNFYAENVAMFQSSDSDPVKVAKQFVVLWNGSPGHRENMLGAYTYIGAGIARSGTSFYATQLFH